MAFKILQTVFLIILIQLGQCQETSLVFYLLEEQKFGAFVGSVSSSPNILNMVGEDDRAGLRYSILDNSNSLGNLFQIDTDSGNITVAGRVDRESVCPLSDTCDIKFGVAVSGDNNFFTTIPVDIKIEDINDNRPTFQAPATIDVHINEASPINFTQSLTTATDPDMSAAFGVNSYAIIPESEIFRVQVTPNLVGTLQVSLVLKQTLNRETTDSYRLLVVAKDGGDTPQSGTLTVNVIVDDFNDNPPVFSQKYYTANFSENAAPGYEVITVLAEDKDVENNGKVVYSLLSNQGVNTANIKDKFSVDNVTGQVVLKESLQSGEYKILIEAKDLGNPQKSDQAVVTISVLDTDNNQPIVTLNPVQRDDLPKGWVSEDAEISSVVAVLTVDDPDSGKNGNVSCESLEPAFQLQQLQPGSYKLMVANLLDREKNSSFSVTVLCQDQGSPSLNATATIVINVYDTNDNKPVFGKPSYVENMVENNMKGDPVTVVNALDKDEGDNAVVEYRLANTGGNFTITSDGVIKASRRFDREEKSSYQFSVLAVDRGDPRQTGIATVTVNIVDLNDVAPAFSKESYKFHLYENRDSDSVVGNVSVSDPDLGNGGVVFLSLSPINENDDVPFTVNNEGRISSLKTFDREEKNTYSFYVVATDNGQRKLSSSAQVTVEILDINDNKPNFIFPSDQNFSAYVNVPIQQDDVTLKVDVYDADENKNSIITYSIVSTNASDLFRIGKFSGDIIANRDLGASDIGTYSITINATDQGLKVLWEARTLHLVVQSESTNPDDVIADQNVLIVACIICFTVIVSGAVVVAMCVLRRLDRQKKSRYVSSCCPDHRRNSENESIDDNNQQYDLAGTKEPSPKVDHNSQYHQQQHQSNHHSNNFNTSNNVNFKPDPSKGFSPGFSGNVHPPNQAGPAFLSANHRHQIPESSLQRHDDFHSTSSAETGTGDSGHGSDEDMSNSMEHANTPVMMVEHAVPLSHVYSLASSSNQSRDDSGVSVSSGRPQHHVQRNSALKNPPRIKQTSVRFDPHVTDIYENNKPSRSQPLPNHGHIVNNNNTSIKPTAGSHRQPQPYNLLKQKQQEQLNRPQQYQQGRPYQVPVAPPTIPGKASVPVYLPHQKQLSSLSQLSIGDDANDDSDLNTTTSGSYSVASDDVARLNSLADIKDLYV